MPAGRSPGNARPVLCLRRHRRRGGRGAELRAPGRGLRPECGAVRDAPDPARGAGGVSDRLRRSDPPGGAAPGPPEYLAQEEGGAVGGRFGAGWPVRGTVFGGRVRWPARSGDDLGAVCAGRRGPAVAEGFSTARPRVVDRPGIPGFRASSRGTAVVVGGARPSRSLADGPARSRLGRGACCDRRFDPAGAARKGHAPQPRPAGRCDALPRRAIRIEGGAGVIGVSGPCRLRPAPPASRRSFSLAP